MSRKAIVISLVAMFLSGAALGLMGGIFFSHDMHARAMGGPMGPHGGMLREFGPPDGPGRVLGGRGAADRDPLDKVLPRLTRMLELTPEQVARLEPKVRESRQQFGAVRESLHARIESELTPEQIARWREMRRHMPNPGEPRGPWNRAHRADPGNEGEPR